MSGDERDPAGVVKDALEQYPDLPDHEIVHVEGQAVATFTTYPCGDERPDGSLIGVHFLDGVPPWSTVTVIRIPEVES